jgi:hypothetical protein
MIDKRLFTAATLLGLGLGLASCGQFSGYVADHWPHWAGGLPSDVPPRPGAPGYTEFIAHGQARQDSADSAASQQPAAGMVPMGVQEPPAPPAAPVTLATQPQATPPASAPEDSSVLKGGLY